jgi:hypothetical protein
MNRGETVWLFGKVLNHLPQDRRLRERDDVFQPANQFEETAERRLRRLQVCPCGIFLWPVPVLAQRGVAQE